jgi:hypothetical protein
VKEKKEPVRILTEHKDARCAIRLREDYIVEVRLQPMLYKKPDVEYIISTINNITANKAMLVLVVTENGSDITFDGIKVLFSKDSLSYPIAKAYYIRKKLHFFLSRICMLLYRPATPIKFFNDEAAAEKWLKSLISCEI